MSDLRLLLIITFCPIANRRMRGRKYGNIKNELMRLFPSPLSRLRLGGLEDAGRRFGEKIPQGFALSAGQVQHRNSIMGPGTCGCPVYLMASIWLSAGPILRLGRPAEEKTL